MASDSDDDDLFGPMGAFSTAQPVLLPEAFRAGESYVPGEPLCRVALDGLSMQRFRESFLRPRVPVVLFQGEKAFGNACDSLRLAQETLCTAALAQGFGHLQVPLDAGDARVRLSTFLEALAGPKEEEAPLSRRYLRNLHLSEWFPGLARQLRLPTAFGPNFLHNEARTPGVPEAWRNWFELFICGANNDGFPFFHQDTCHVHAVAMQLQGRKRFLLAEPSASDFLVPGGRDGLGSTSNSTLRWTSRSTSRSRVPLAALVRHFGRQEAGESSRDAEYPELEHVRLFSVEISGGEMLFVPSDWWHIACHGATFDRLLVQMEAGLEGNGPADADADEQNQQLEEASVTLQASFVDHSLLDAFNGAWADLQNVKALQRVGAGGLVSR